MRFEQTLRRLVAATLCGTLLAGCGSDEDSNAADAAGEANAEITQALSGSVGDGPVVGATLTVSTKSGAALKNAVSDQTAGYNIQVRAKGRDFPLVIEATGGIDLVTNVAPDFTLVGAALSPSRNEVANLSPFSTLALATARELEGGLTSDNVVSAIGIVVSELNSGLDALAPTGALNERIDDTSLAEMVKASETLAETFRRTNDVMLASSGDSTVDRVIAALGADLVDGRIEGVGSDGADAHVSAVALVAAAQVSLESMSNELDVHGASATAALDDAINQLAQAPMDAPTSSVPITAGMIEQAKLGVSAAAAIEPSEALAALLTVLDGMSAGMLPADAAGVLPAGASSALEPALTRLTSGLAEDIAAVNAVNGGPDAAPGDPGDPGDGGGDGNTAPVISGSPGTTATVGVEYEFAPSASDDDGDTLTFSVTNAPAWADFDPATGRLGGTPASGDVAVTADIVISVSDGQASASLPAFSLTVEEAGASPDPNSPPVISGTPSTTVLQETAYRFVPEASDPDGDPLVFSIENAPAWASFDSTNGELSGTPSAADVGTYGDIRIGVSDGSAAAELAPFAIEVQAVALGTATLSWTAPSLRTDGSALTDLAGYRIYWGTSSADLGSSADIDNPGVTTYVVENLSSGTYFFAVTAVDSNGLESDYSNVASKEIP